MKPAELLEFLRTQRLAVQASAGGNDAPQSALVGIAVSDSFELIFDTLDTTRKAKNLRNNPKIAFVIGGSNKGDERTVQYEGIADEPTGSELERIKSIYFSAWPDGTTRQSSPGIIYFRVRPTWIRYSDYTRDPPAIVELTDRDLGMKS